MRRYYNVGTRKVLGKRMAFRRQCPDCGVIYYSDKDHKCAKPTKAKPPERIEDPVKTAPVKRAKAVVTAGKPVRATKATPERNGVVSLAEAVAKAPAQPEPKSEAICQPPAKKRLTPAERTKRWREKNAEKHSTYMKRYAKDRRAKSSEERDFAKFQELKSRCEGKGE